MGFLKNLKEGLFKSSSNISEGVSNIFLKSIPNEKILEEIEDCMIQCDFGIDVASKFKLILANKKFSDAKWIEININFLTKGHKYHSDYALKNWSKGKDKNLSKLLKDKNFTTSRKKNCKH